MEARAATATSERPTIDQVREKATQVKADLRELGNVTKEVATEKFDHWYKEGREKVIHLEKSFESQIREHPLQSVLIAAGTGFLAGYLVSRRR
jgi:ElaB/YqjD/DUF883 family membrane-anchored ribosome-binding protein